MRVSKSTFSGLSLSLSFSLSLSLSPFSILVIYFGPGTGAD